MMGLACGPGSPELSKSYMDMASKLFTFTFTFYIAVHVLHSACITTKLCWHYNGCDVQDGTGDCTCMWSVSKRLLSATTVQLNKQHHGG